MNAADSRELEPDGHRVEHFRDMERASEVQGKLFASYLQGQVSGGQPHLLADVVRGSGTMLAVGPAGVTFAGLEKH